MVWRPVWHLSYQPQFHEPTWKMGENFCASSSPLVSTVSHKSSVRTNMVQAKLIQSHVLKIYLDVVCWGTTILKMRYLIHLLCNLLRAHFTYRLGQRGMLHLPHCVHIWGFFLLWTHTLEIAKDTELALHFKCQSWIISMWKKSDRLRILVCRRNTCSNYSWSNVFLFLSHYPLSVRKPGYYGILQRC